MLSKKELGEKLGTEVACGCISLKFYEHGMEIKPYNQVRIRLGSFSQDVLFRALKSRAEREQLVEAL